MGKRRYRRLLIMADGQAGHRAGLTPPAYQWQDGSKWQDLQDYGWRFFVGAVEKWLPYDCVLYNGDAIDGEGSRSDGIERMRNSGDQVDMAVEAIKVARCKKVRMTWGTWYHVRSLENYIAKSLQADGYDANLKFWQFLRINGVEVNARHHTGNSSIQHGEATPLLKEVVTNQRWSKIGIQRDAEIIIRSHVHRHLKVHQDGIWSVTTPSLQMLGDIYGSTRCSGVVHFGIIVLDVYDDGEIIWHDEIMRSEVQRESSEAI